MQPSQIHTSSHNKRETRRDKRETQVKKSKASCMRMNTWTRLYGSMSRTRFCSSKVSYKSARWVEMMASRPSCWSHFATTSWKKWTHDRAHHESHLTDGEKARAGNSEGISCSQLCRFCPANMGGGPNIIGSLQHSREPSTHHLECLEGAILVGFGHCAHRLHVFTNVLKACFRAYNTWRKTQPV